MSVKLPNHYSGTIQLKWLNSTNFKQTKHWSFISLLSHFKLFSQSDMLQMKKMYLISRFIDVNVLNYFNATCCGFSPPPHIFFLPYPLPFSRWMIIYVLDFWWWFVMYMYMCKLIKRAHVCIRFYRTREWSWRKTGHEWRYQRGTSSAIYFHWGRKVKMCHSGSNF